MIEAHLSDAPGETAWVKVRPAAGGSVVTFFATYDNLLDRWLVMCGDQVLARHLSFEVAAVRLLQRARRYERAYAAKARKLARAAA